MASRAGLARARHLACALGLAALGAAPLRAQRVSPTDSALLARVLLAEENRDTTAAAYADGLRSGNGRIRDIARRGQARSRDARFAARDSVIPKLDDPPKYDDPAWRLRYRQLGNRNDNCTSLGIAMGDSAWAVRLRAADLVTSACATDTVVVNALLRWTATPPTSGTRRAGGVSWHAAAHGLVALARTSPGDARTALPQYSASSIRQLRAYAARAAAVLGDTATLIRLAGDPDDNVKEAAVGGLARVAGHAADVAIIGVLQSPGYQAVRAAAAALRETPMRDVALPVAIAAAYRLRADSSETSRDARRAVVNLVAELAAPSDWPRIAPLAADFDCTIADTVAGLGRALGDTGVAAHCTPLPVTLPPDAVRLALGADVRLRVTLADSSGGGSFVVRLRGDVAPVMAARVLDLARRGYYDGLTWHRVEANFVVQGLGPGANEYIGYPRFFRDELGTIQHNRGTIGMSTRGHDTGDGQWFINLSDNARLTRDYTVFAEVTDGIAVVDGILEGDVVAKVEMLPPR